jgi:capsular exopolysaccharide synthesis family protein
MDGVDYLGAFRRWWAVILASVAIGVTVGWAVRPTASPTAPRYEATAAILGSADIAVTNLGTLSAVATIGDVPQRVAKAIGYEGDPHTLAEQIETLSDQATGILRLTASSSTPERAQLLADTFARQLVRWDVARRIQSSLQQQKLLRTQIDRAAKQITALERQIQGAGPDVSALLTAKRDALVTRYGLLIQQSYQAANAPPPPISILSSARAERVKTGAAGLFASLSQPVVMLIGGLLGLVAGLALALFLDRFDRRIRTRAAAERSFQLPVVAEIAPLSRRDRRRAIVAASGGVSSSVEPYTVLGAVLAQSTPTTARPGGNGHAAKHGQTILVTSPSASDRKSRVAGSLATALAQTGKRVVLVSCDLRHPQVHRLFDISNDRGLSDALRAQNGARVLEPVAQRTALSNLVVVPSGPATTNPGELLTSERIGRALDEARGVADVVLVDAPALLEGGEGVVLLDEADSVLVVAKAGRTTQEEAERTTDILKRLEAPVVGVALDGASRVGFSPS